MGRRAALRRLGAVATSVAAVAAPVAVAGCSGDDVDTSPVTTVVTADPVCGHLADLGEAWGRQASGPVLGDHDALRAAGKAQVADIAAAAEAAVATGEVPDAVAADLEVVAAGGATYLADAVAWATGDAPDVAPTIPVGVIDAQRRIDEWALERCGAEVWA